MQVKMFWPLCMIFVVGYVCFPLLIGIPIWLGVWFKSVVGTLDDTAYLLVVLISAPIYLILTILIVRIWRSGKLYHVEGTVVQTFGGYHPEEDHSHPAHYQTNRDGESEWVEESDGWLPARSDWNWKVQIQAPPGNRMRTIRIEQRKSELYGQNPYPVGSKMMLRKRHLSGFLAFLNYLFYFWRIDAVP